jgi:glycine/D-amino acid oxidase-like deaminating enzyme
MEAAEVAARYGIVPRAALLSRGSWEVNPVKLTTALLERARSSGCTVSWPIDVVAIEGGNHPRLQLEDGRSLEAEQIVIAGGYERAPLFLPTEFSLKSSYAIATPRDTPPLWRERAMIWEASSTYTYARSTSDGRTIAGGEDEDLTEPDKRDRLLPEKRDALARKLAALAGVADVPVDCVWSATFGSSPDGLPAIGPAANYDGLWLASGFGGNGISFAALGAELIASGIAGETDLSSRYFDPYRFENRPRSA